MNYKLQMEVDKNNIKEVRGVWEVLEKGGMESKHGAVQINYYINIIY